MMECRSSDLNNMMMIENLLNNSGMLSFCKKYENTKFNQKQKKFLRENLWIIESQYSGIAKDLVPYTHIGFCSIECVNYFNNVLNYIEHLKKLNII